jgi:methylenetetrahydrofolate dehydrogenase (NADP+)/methenyltetrahydrofolate cyclohydrolase
VRATVIDGKAAAARLRARLADEVAEHVRLHGRPPGLATVLVGEDPASALYVEGKQRACREVGMAAFDERLPADADRGQVAAVLEALCGDPAISGVLLQLPLPDHLPAQELIAMIDPLKDVDGLTPINAGLLALGREGLRPCTPLGVLCLLEEAGAALEGAEAVVIGRSNLFGKPMAALLLLANATVTICHSRTRDLAAVARRADILIAAAGRPRMVQAGWVKQGAIVIDVGISRISPQQAGNRSGLVGDVDFEPAAEVASAITPVPGGVGPMTIAMLIANTLQAARMQVEARR